MSFNRYEALRRQAGRGSRESCQIVAEAADEWLHSLTHKSGSVYDYRISEELTQFGTLRIRRLVSVTGATWTPRNFATLFYDVRVESRAKVDSTFLNLLLQTRDFDI